MDVEPDLSASVTVDFDVPVAMRDGVILRANLYRPADLGPLPALLTRLPYGKDDPRVMGYSLDPVLAARSGFLVVVQDTRGRGTSEGDWVPFQFERADGYDSVEWAAALPGCTGHVGLFGVSYFGNTQWAAAIERPPSLGAIAPGMTWSEPLDGAFARGGALELGLTLPWTLETGAGYIARLPTSEAERDRRLTAILHDYDRLLSEGYWDLPVSDMAIMRRHGVPDPGTIRMLADPDVPNWCRVAGEQQHVQVPTLNIGGWYDAFLQGTIDNYMAMAALGRPTRLVIGPWSHDTRRDPIGEVCFGVQSTGYVPGDDLSALQLHWFRRHLEPAEVREDAPAESPVRIFVMGRNEWRDEPAWPVERASIQRWFLGPGGTLGPTPPTIDVSPTSFLYDPADPVPTVGGHTVMEPALLSGPCEQSRVESRADVCVFTSTTLRQDLEVTGRVRVVLHAESSAPSTDWVARLCDVAPDGRSFNVCDGILRLHCGADVCVRVEIDLWSTSMVFFAGHRLRVHITSSSFPRWDRNLNTGNQREPQIRVARQSVHHDAQRPSRIELPVCP